MYLKCPLCLKQLEENDLIARYCSEHPDLTEEFPFIEESLSERIYCPARDCRLNGAIGFPGVFLRHIGCEAKNPFRGSSGKVSIPGRRDSEESIYTDLQGKSYIFNHWEIGMLRYVPWESEMWFPQMLMRSMTEKRSGKRMGVMVELAGAQTVGKTVLAMQAMDEQGYVPNHKNDRYVEVKGFLFSRVPEGVSAGSSPFMAALCLRSLHKGDAHNLFTLGGTMRGTGDLKTVFLRPAPDRTEDKQTAVSKDDSFLKNLKELFFKPLLELIVGMDRSSANADINEPWYTVAFYDTAGESQQAGDFTLHAVENGVDKIALLINANDLFTPGGGSSLQAARERMPELRRKGIENCCLVVTRMDEILYKLSQQDRNEVHRLVDTFDTGDEPRKISRALLLKWFEQQTSQNDNNKLSLRRYLENNDIPVFFVWTRGLAARGAKGEQPVSYGLAHLICWCLGIEWRHINQKKSP